MFASHEGSTAFRTEKSSVQLEHFDQIYTIILLLLIKPKIVAFFKIIERRIILIHLKIKRSQWLPFLCLFIPRPTIPIDFHLWQLRIHIVRWPIFLWFWYLHWGVTRACFRAHVLIQQTVGYIVKSMRKLHESDQELVCLLWDFSGVHVAIFKYFCWVKSRKLVHGCTLG